MPRRRVKYRGHARSRRWTCRRVLAAHRSSRLIDELAHTNAPGVEHEKRYEDIEDVLDAGIDVFSTVNVQHLESLNDQVAELTGVRVRETVPDAVLGAADEVVLIDLTPEAPARAAAGGQGLPAGARASGAQQLLQDREPRRPARDRAAPGRRGGRGQAAGAPRASPGTREERIAGRRRRRRSASGCSRWSRPRPRSQRVVRRAWRSAQRLGAELDLLFVRPPGAPAERRGARAAGGAARGSPRARRAPARRGGR